jgi:hypothetical protein
VNEAKPIYLSVTFWGTVITTVSLLFPDFYAKLGITDQSVLVAHIVGLIGAFIAIYGRLRARKIVTLTGAPPAGRALK